MTDRLERFEKVVGELAKMEPHAWDAVVVYERVAGLAYCGLCAMSMLSAAIAWAWVVRRGPEVSDAEDVGRGDVARVATAICIMVSLFTLSFNVYDTLPNEAARAVSPEAALINRMLE